ncbi:Uncharacterised protein [Candidatus Burarchaeum australiense]|nr:Uncharacterised protein [Candidatus Burarchaeum australiense]
MVGIQGVAVPRNMADLSFATGRDRTSLYHRKDVVLPPELMPLKRNHSRAFDPAAPQGGQGPEETPKPALSPEEKAALKEKAKELTVELKNDKAGSDDLKERASDMISNCDLGILAQEHLVGALASHPSEEFRKAVLEATKTKIYEKLKADPAFEGEYVAEADKYANMLDKIYAQYRERHVKSSSAA